jgi:Tol biopolymer transport system component
VVAECRRQSRLVAGRHPDPLPLVHEDDTTQAQIFTIAADGSNLRQLTHFPDDTFVGSSSYSPDGTQILFSTAAPGGRADVSS